MGSSPPEHANYDADIMMINTATPPSIMGCGIPTQGVVKLTTELALKATRSY